MILHVDMDSFYASVEERERPELVGRPVVVGGTSEGRGVVAAANYAIRKFGVHSAMPTATALRLCPQAIVLPVRMSHYATISRQIRDIFFRYTPLVELLSLDEAFLDVTGSEGLFGKAEKIARRIRQEIKSETSLVASVGVAPNKFLAKIASDLEKPDGLVVVPRDRIQEFLDPLPVGRLWGVGKVTGGVFDRLGIYTIGQLRRLSTDTLRQRFGSQGEHFWRLARGIDDRAVVPDREAKSISHETTFAADISDTETLRAWLLDLTEQVTRRLRRQKQQARTVHLKVGFTNFRTITRSRTLPHSTDVTDDIWHAAKALLLDALPALVGPLHPIRCLWLAGWAALGETWVSAAMECRRDFVSPARDVLLNRLVPSNHPPCLSGGHSSVFTAVDNIHPMWTLYASNIERDARGLVGNVCSAIGLPEPNIGGVAVTGKYLAGRVQRYVNQPRILGRRVMHIPPISVCCSMCSPQKPSRQVSTSRRNQVRRCTDCCRTSSSITPTTEKSSRGPGSRDMDWRHRYVALGPRRSGSSRRVVMVRA